MNSFEVFVLFFVGIMIVTTIQLVAYVIVESIVTSVMEKRYSNKLESRAKTGKYCVILKPTNSRYPIRYYSDDMDEIMNLYSDLAVHYSSDRITLNK